MVNYLVISHERGDYYVSNANPKILTSKCRVCGDRDEIVASWDSDIENSKIDSIAEYLGRDTIKTEEDLDSEFEMYNNYEEDKFKIIYEILSDIYINNSSIIGMIDYFEEEKFVNEKEARELENRNRELLKHQICIVRDNLSKYFSDEKDIARLKLEHKELNN